MPKSFFTFLVFSLILSKFSWAGIDHERLQPLVNRGVRMIFNNMNFIPGILSYNIATIRYKRKPGKVVALSPILLLAEGFNLVPSLLYAPKTIKMFQSDIKKIEKLIALLIWADKGAKRRLSKNIEGDLKKFEEHIPNYHKNIDVEGAWLWLKKDIIKYYYNYVPQKLEQYSINYNVSIPKLSRRIAKIRVGKFNSVKDLEKDLEKWSRNIPVSLQEFSL